MNSGIWFGFAVDVGGHLGIWGTNTMYANFYSLDSYQKSFSVQSERTRWGPGLGGGIGLNFYIVTSLQDPMGVQAMETETWDFQLAIGAKWGALIKGLSKSRKLAQVVKHASETKGLTKAALKLMTRLEPGDYVDISKRLREMVQSMDLKTDAATPQTFNMGIPIPGALEVSVFKQYGTWTVLSVNQPTP
ncbi:hypothetical protein KUV47_04575 [Vannielia litorea]|uniref:hypothetical protein n=1 Tax=Vannielia litorea TaxID=1217970 RepID=UPI001C9442A4|nr:hypothetical protein [Vannielia litorea]MBY6152478.1 hypothetical protein [Vannielia litorea]